MSESLRHIPTSVKAESEDISRRAGRSSVFPLGSIMGGAARGEFYVDRDFEHGDEPAIAILDDGRVIAGTARELDKQGFYRFSVHIHEIRQPLIETPITCRVLIPIGKDFLIIRSNIVIGADMQEVPQNRYGGSTEAEWELDNVVSPQQLTVFVANPQATIGTFQCSFSCSSES